VAKEKTSQDSPKVESENAVAVNGTLATERPVVSIAKIKDGRIDIAVEEAMDLLGGVQTVTMGKERIMLKPNLVGESPSITTKPEVVKTLARLMQKAGKEVSVGEGSVAVSGFNMKGAEMYRTRNQQMLDEMQQVVFDRLGYTEIANSMGIELVGLHSGEMATVKLPNGLFFDQIELHRSLVDIDLLCSVPMMKTHILSTVTLGMKNLMGVLPGTVYCSPRVPVHDQALEAGSPGIAFEIVDLVRANKLGLVIIDASMAMEGRGPTRGRLVKMDLIIAGTNPLATDMVGANVMGFEPDEVPMFVWANKVGMHPHGMAEIEVRGQALDSVRREFKRPRIVSWRVVRDLWGGREIV
jgi:uncharacterized protein (DUF362 family)